MISYTPSSPNPPTLYSPPSNYNTSYLSYPSYYSPPTPPPTSPPPLSPPMPTRSNHYANSSTITINKLMITTTNNNLNTSNNNLNYEHYDNYENYDNIPNPHSPLPSNTPPPPSASPSPSPSPSPTPQQKQAKPLHSTTIYINNHEYTCSGGQENQQKILMAFKETSKLPSSVPGPLLMLDESRQEVDALIAKEYSSYVQMRTISTSIVNEVRTLLGKGISCPMSLVCTLREQLQLLKEALEVLCYTEEKKVSFSHQLVQDAVERWYMSGTRGKRKIEECEEPPQKQSNGQAQTQSPEPSSSNSSPNSTSSSSPSSSATPSTESSVPQRAKKKKRTSKQNANTKLDESNFSHTDSTSTSRATLKRDRDSSKLMSINNIIN